MDEAEIAEIWLPVNGFPGYEVSDHGCVRSWRKNGPTDELRDAPRIMTPSNSSKGYLHVNLWRDGSRFTRNVHRLVLEAFVGSCPYGEECRHLNGKPSENGLENLAWGTHSDNILDAVSHGTHPSFGRRSNPRRIDRVPGHYTPENREARREERRVAGRTANSTSKLTADDVRRMRAMRETHQLKEIGSLFGLSKQTVHKIVTRQRWRHVD